MPAVAHPELTGNPGCFIDRQVAVVVRPVIAFAGRNSVYQCEDSQYPASKPADDRCDAQHPQSVSRRSYRNDNECPAGYPDNRRQDAQHQSWGASVCDYLGRSVSHGCSHGLADGDFRAVHDSVVLVCMVANWLGYASVSWRSCWISVCKHTQKGYGQYECADCIAYGTSHSKHDASSCLPKSNRKSSGLVLAGLNP